MALPNPNPLSTTFDKIWIQNLIICGSPKTNVSLTATLKPYDGEHILDDTKTLRIPDIFDLASKDSQFKALLDQVMTEVIRQATVQGVL